VDHARRDLRETPKEDRLVSRKIASVLTLLLFAATGAAGQQGEQVRLETVEVLVDAVVLDKDKRPVTGLTAADFEVLEDGQPQQITRALAVTGRRGADPATASSVATYHTIVVTDGTVQDIHLVDVRAALEKYVRTVMTDDNYVTLFTIGSGGLRLLQPTTNDKEALIAAIANAKNGGIGTLREAERAGIDFARGGLPTDTYSTYADPATEEGVSTGGAGGLAAGPAQPPDQREIALRVARRALGRAEELHALGTSWTAYDALAALIDAHRVVPGRRSITVFSEGFLQVQQAEPVKEKVLNAAAGAGVTLYVVDARGLAAESERGSASRVDVDRTQNAARMRGSDLTSERTSSIGGGIFDAIPRETATRTDILAELATKTGGLFMKNSNDLFTGLAEIDRDQQNYYLIFYAPKRPLENGEYRTIDVRVRDRSGIAVRAREGYFAMPSEARGLFRLEDQRLYLRAHRAGAARGLAFDMRAYAFGAPSGATRVSYAIKLPPEATVLREAKEKRFTGSYYGLLIARDAGGRMLATERVPISLDLSAGQAELARKEGLRFEGGFDVAAGEVAHVEAIFSSDERDEVGMAAQAVRGLDWSAGPAASDVVLGRAVVVPGPSDETSFQTGGKYLVPLPRPVFHPDDAMTVLAAVYWPEGREMRTPVLSIWQGKQLLASLEVPLTPAAGGTNGWVFTAIPCKEIPPGEYLMRLVVSDTQGRSSMRQIPFVIRADRGSDRAG
jgi:VWFA-related protein